MTRREALGGLAMAGLARAEDWRPLFNGRNLDGWEERGSCSWSVMADGTLVGKRERPKDEAHLFPAWPVDEKQFRSWLGRQAWLYTKAEFGEFDLALEYWIPPGGNSGVSIRDVSRAHYAIGEPEGQGPALNTKLKGTPAHIGYEIQIIDPDNNTYPTGSVYLFQAAKTGFHKRAQWNRLEIESRSKMIRVKLNGAPVAESAGDPARSKAGPIGLQLHDQFTIAMFRNIRIREIR